MEIGEITGNLNDYAALLANGEDTSAYSGFITSYITGDGPKIEQEAYEVWMGHMLILFGAAAGGLGIVKGLKAGAQAAHAQAGGQKRRFALPPLPELNVKAWLSSIKTKLPIGLKNNSGPPEQ